MEDVRRFCIHISTPSFAARRADVRLESAEIIYDNGFEADAACTHRTPGFAAVRADVRAESAANGGKQQVKAADASSAVPPCDLTTIMKDVSRFCKHISAPGFAAGRADVASRIGRHPL